ncbi:Miro-like protein [Gimesia aquarii]|uniref:non-specific serine/threonine protein kinase n=1 Tax=Gimesia aquarii TaxID=2527964 RepID=A0A517VRA0_9PLAN|nr:Miro-like protein [Gimesia aquarii]
MLPDEAISGSDAEAILAAYRRFHGSEAHRLQPLREARLLVLGNEAVGKTSLVSYLVDNEFRNPAEEKTPGARLREKIEVQAWADSSPAPLECDVKLNVWDFGGQDIYHRTHRFFLSARSLYLIVLEARREDDRSYVDWLRTIQSRAGDAPTIIVINKSDGAHRNTLQLDKSGLCREFPGIVDIVRTSCEETEVDAPAMIQTLRELIVHTLEKDERLKHVREPVAPEWLAVKERLTMMASEQPVLQFNRFEALCEEQEITNVAEQRGLLRTLHHLGTVVAHGLDNEDTPLGIRNVELLDPNWLTTAIYSVMTDCSDRAEMVERPAEFTRQDLRRILDQERYSPERDSYEYILDMMQHDDIQLIYELPGKKGCYLLPAALPKNRPELNDWPGDGLLFRYRYEFLPPGLLSQFIVQAHEHVTATRWRTGVVLEVRECRVLVEAKIDDDIVDIQVQGRANRRRDALNVTAEYLEIVHRRFGELGAEACVPLPEQPQLDESYDHLLILEGDEQDGPNHEYRPRGAKRKFTVSELLNGVRLSIRARSDIHITNKFYGGDDMSETYNTSIGDGNKDVSITQGKGINRVTADKIEGSFNQAAQSDASDEVKTLLRELAGEVANIAAEQAPEDADATADALETLTKEATRLSPRKDWWDLSVKGIQDAAKAVGTVGATAVVIAEKLGGLLFD